MKEQTKGQKALIRDLEDVLKEAKDGEYGDFTNKKYPAPKVTLADIFFTFRENVINGKYDD